MNTSILKPLLLTIMLTMLIVGVQAHALWIHTKSTAEKGIPHTYKIYYADYHEKAIEPVAKWYSDLKEFELWLISPSGKKIRLESTATQEYFEGSFIPEEDGEYRMEISHTADPEESLTSYQFNTYAQVWVGKGKSMAKVETDLALIRDANSSTYEVLYKGKPLDEAELIVLGPKSKVQELKTSKNGKVSVDLTEKGIYFIEATYTQQLSENDSSGLKAIWRCATQVITVD